MILDTLEQNGVSEWTNCALVKASIAMFNHSRVSNLFWVKNLITIVICVLKT
jgi:hypothetical protein